MWRGKGDGVHKQIRCLKYPIFRFQEYNFSFLSPGVWLCSLLAAQGSGGQPLVPGRISGGCGLRGGVLPTGGCEGAWYHPDE